MVRPWVALLFALSALAEWSPALAQARQKKDAVNEALGPEVQALLKDLKGKDPKKRLIAAQDLGKLGEKAPFEVRRALCLVLLDRNEGLMKASLDSLRKIDPEFYKPLAVVMLNRSGDARDDQADVRRAVVEIGELRERGSAAEPILVALLKQSFAGGEPLLDRPGRYDETVCEAVMEALRKIQPRDLGTFSHLASLASPGVNQYPHVRLDALISLRYFAANYDRDEAVKEEIRRKSYQLYKTALNDPDPACVSQAARSIGEYGPDAKDALPILKKLKFSSNETVRAAAIAAIDKIEGGK
jgi:HEAT repeat protein